MRLLLFIPALLTSLVLPSAALADDYFTYIPTTGPTVTFTLNSGQIYNVSPYYAVQFGNVLFSNGTKGDVTVKSPSFGITYGGIPADISLGASESSPGAGNQFGANFSGAQLFSNQIGADVNFVPIFAPGVYHLTGFPAGTLPVSATLCVDTACSVAPTPEPSSLYLLGSGALGLFGMAGLFRKH